MIICILPSCAVMGVGLTGSGQGPIQCSTSPLLQGHPEGTFVLREELEMQGNIFACHNGRIVIGIWSAEPRDAVKHPMLCKRALSTVTLLPQRQPWRLTIAPLKHPHGKQLCIVLSVVLKYIGD